MAPFDLTALFGTGGAWLVYLAIGFAFGFILESSGFGDARRLAAQFYFREMRVVKVMFTAIVVAMLLVFWSTALGLLDYSALWVNPTWLWPGIVGGIIMGIGFILGGYCPGTSLVSAATLKIDGLFFLLGLVAGVTLFGETVSYIDAFWHSGDMGVFTLPQLLHLDTGTVALLVVGLALVMFAGFEWLRALIYGPAGKHRPATAAAGAAVLLLAAAGLGWHGQPDVAQQWQYLAAKYEPRLAAREVYIDPGELLALMNDDYIDLVIFDVRDEPDWNLFHLADAERVPLEALPRQRERLRALPENAVLVVVSNDEMRATEAWKHLMVIVRPNAYILAGGLNQWLSIYGAATDITSTQPDGTLRHEFKQALGDRHAAARPDEHHAPQRDYEPKVRLLKKIARAGGCG